MDVQIPVDRGAAENGLHLEGDFEVPYPARGVVVFAHGSGSSRNSPRNQQVAARLRDAGWGTLLFDLLTPREDAIPGARFDIELLGLRLVAATRWLEHQPEAEVLAVGYFGASTGAAAALIAAAELGPSIAAVVSRGGRPDLAMSVLPRVMAPTLLIVGGRDLDVLELNRRAARALQCPNQVAVVPGATHLFEQPGALEEVERLAEAWFERYLTPAAASAAPSREPSRVA
jgi:pimeloyl-ACP methyl ester carboxylesterase